MSQTAKHTPGPWEAEPMEDGCSVSYRINDAHGYEIGVTSGRDGKGEEEANARLIAAAPTMKADLDEFMRRLGPRWFLEQGWFPASLMPEERS